VTERGKGAYERRHNVDGNFRRIPVQDGEAHPFDGGDAMSVPHPSDQPVPLGQRLLNRPFLLLLAGLLVMFGFYTIWGLYEILSLPKATLP
jgi:hypothetical protein